jgi:hypothetical protein
LSNQTQPLNLSGIQSHLSAYSYHSSVSITEDILEDEPDMYIDQMWFEQSVDNIDPWKNVELEPIFQYPLMENEFLSFSISQ